MSNESDKDAAFYKTNTQDIVLIALVLVLSVFFIAREFRSRTQQVSQPGIVFVFQGDRQLKEIKLGQDGTFPIIDGRMQVEVRKGRVRVLSSDCPQHICMHSGWIQHAGQTIVCVPNRVLIEIRSRVPQVIDAVAL